MRVVNLVADGAEGEIEVVVYALGGDGVVIVVNGARGCIGRIVVPSTSEEMNKITVEMMGPLAGTRTVN